MTSITDTIRTYPELDLEGLDPEEFQGPERGIATYLRALPTPEQVRSLAHIAYEEAATSEDAVPAAETMLGATSTLLEAAMEMLTDDSEMEWFEAFTAKRTEEEATFFVRWRLSHRLHRTLAKRVATNILEAIEAEALADFYFDFDGDLTLMSDFVRSVLEDHSDSYAEDVRTVAYLTPGSAQIVGGTSARPAHRVVRP